MEVGVSLSCNQLKFSHTSNRVPHTLILYQMFIVNHHGITYLLNNGDAMFDTFLL